jgi:hypothetical protein
LAAGNSSYRSCPAARYDTLMNSDQLKSLAKQLAAGTLSLDGFLREMARP